MQKFAALIFASFGFFASATPAFATWIAPVGPGICTRDFNPWGKASTCQCPHATRYENRLGQCVQGAPVEKTVEGTIAPTLDDEGVVVVYTLTTEDKLTYNIVLPVVLRDKFEDASFQAIKFNVAGGILENFEGTPIAVPTIILEKIESVDVVIENLWPIRQDHEVLFEEFN